MFVQEKSVISMANTSPRIQWKWFEFSEISPFLLTEIFKLRQDIFIVEQNVPYKDIDGKDPSCLHLAGMHKAELLAYMRIVPVDLFETGYWSLGRVIIRHDIRGSGLGRLLVQTGIDRLEKLRGEQPIKISSQLYLQRFYESFGFVSIGSSYIEDHIPHIAMIKD